MPVECFNHPGIAARGKCSECGHALCEQCKLTFKSRPVCEHCLETIRHRLATDATAVFEAPSAVTTIPDIDSQTATRSVDVVLEARESLQQANRPSEVRKVLQGSIVALIIGIVLSLLVAKIRSSFGYPIGFAHVIVGAAVGYGMVIAARDGGELQSIAAAVIAAFTLVSGIYFLANDQNSAAAGGIAPDMLTIGQFFGRVGNFPSDWIFVLFGVIAAFLIARKSRNEVG